MPTLLARVAPVLIAGLVVLIAYLSRRIPPGPIDLQHIPGANMDTSQLAEVGHLLVTPSNPAGDAGTLDVARCAALHNYLVRYGWAASGRQLDSLHPLSFFARYGQEAEEIRDRLDASLVRFLESIDIPSEAVSLYFWVSGPSEPSEMFLGEDMLPETEQGHDRFVTLYSTNINMGEHPVGLIYDQRHHRAAMALGLEDLGFTHPANEHDELWFPLEAVLSQWIDMIRIGKITAAPENDDEPTEYPPWTWQSYSAAQVDSTVEAFGRLVAAIEERMPPGSLGPRPETPLLSDAELDAARVPGDCFIRAFLARGTTPRFRVIAPGLLVPHASSFASMQKFTVMDALSESETLVPPVLVFPAAEGRTVNLDAPSRYRVINPFPKPFRDGVPRGDHSTPAGLYSESLDRSATDVAEEGFRLLLPFSPRDASQESGPRKSDGTLLEEGSVADLFQHGFKPFGGEWWRAQRLEILLDHWRELVERGIWTVGPDGVEGTIDVFRGADPARNFRIPPGW